MKWPVLLDSLNLLECKGIPFTLLIDEHGVVRYNNPKEDELSTFLTTSYSKPDNEEASTPFPSKGQCRRHASLGRKVSDHFGD